MFKTILAALVLAATLTGAAQAQDKGKITGMPAQFAAMIDIYRGWKPAHTEEPFANSIYNWGTHVRYEFDSLKRDALRNWVFTRPEGIFRSLATGNAETLKQVFGTVFLARGVGIVFTKSYTADVNGMYASWYDCIAKSMWDDGNEPVGEKLVLAYINWGRGEARSIGSKGECKDKFGALSDYYGSTELSVDDLSSVGFLHRRYVAKQKNPKFIDAEVIREMIHQVFDSE